MAVELKVDFAIVGGGPAGLAAASKLVAQAYTVLFCDEAEYRAECQMTSMFSAYPFNAMNPIDYRRRAHRILAEQFNIQLRTGRVTSVHRIENEADSHFILTVEEGNGEDTKNVEHQAKKVILALGSREEAPNIEGYSLLRHSLMSAFIRTLIGIVLTSTSDTKMSSASVSNIGQIAKISSRCPVVFWPLDLWPKTSIFSFGQRQRPNRFQGSSVQ